ncbi:hypothetical protein [Nocardioides sp. InS609-2]|uniref:hypothetical protein n=1 Tax=Nocardioides sp. InS609-2 TaxID=2760705 RepID=UPI0020BDFBC9|nr:hypothetical protein [Nocardioides sp. InS609-2]
MTGPTRAQIPERTLREDRWWLAPLATFVVFAVGAGVKGGYHGRWPGLANTYDADLAVTTDYRNVLADVVEARFGASSATVFPGLKRSRVGFM